MCCLNQPGKFKMWVTYGIVTLFILLTLGMIDSRIAFSRSNVQKPTAPDVATPSACGTPVSSWGAATADDVRVELLSAQEGMLGSATGSPTADATPTGPLRFISVQFKITNLGQEAVRIEAEDAILTTCAGRELSAGVDILRMASVLGTFEPGETRVGLVTFHLEMQDVPAQVTINIQEQHRTGAYVSCPLAIDPGVGTPSVGTVAAGCSAQGGTGSSGQSENTTSTGSPTSTSESSR